MSFSPATIVYLLDTPLETDYKNQLYFESLADQTNYFESCVKHTFTSFSFQRKDNVIRVTANIESLWNSNYVMYNNSNYTGKWFYAFITKMEYVNENTTAVYIETDVYQTWLFNCELRPSFVKREMLSSEDDVLGANIVEENLETGEYKLLETLQLIRPDKFYYIIVTTVDLVTPSSAILIQNYGKEFSPKMYAFEELGQANIYLTAVNEAGKINGIVGMFVCPSWSIEGKIGDDGSISSFTNVYTNTFQINADFTTVDGYVPKNKKLFTYPYHFATVNNNNGNNMLLKYEYNNLNAFYLQLTCQCSMNGKAILTPSNYKGNNGTSIVNALSTSNFPLLPWISNTYANWVAQNESGLIMGTLGSAVAVAGSISTGNPIGISSGIIGIGNELASIQKHSVLPNESRGTIGGNILIQLGQWGFDVFRMGISANYAERIDQYFDMFGYRTNKVKVPNLNNRPYWNYVETIDINIVGSIPNEDMKKLKAMYNNGVTLWHGGSNYGNYTLNNH